MLRGFIIFTLFITFSCEAQENVIETELKKCINEAVNKNIVEAYGKTPFDFYDFVLDIEKEFLSKKILNNKSKESYLLLLKEIRKSSKNKIHEQMYINQNKIITSYGFGFNSFIINDAIFNQCPYNTSVLEKDGKGKQIYNQSRVLYELMEKGYDNEELLNKLMDSVDEKSFRKIVYRAPVILLVMINLDNRYNPDIKKLEEYKKNRKMYKN